VDIDPPSLVTRIMSVREQISKEWLLDLQTIIDTNDDVLTKYQEHQEQARDNESNLSEENDETAKAKEELEKLIAKPYQDHDKTQEKLVFDQTAMMNFLKPTQVDSTPLRKKSFDLLILLCTQESIHRVLKEYAKEDKMDSVEFLSDFYGDRAGEFFDGPQEFGRADDFLQELFTEPPSIQEKSGGKVSFVDPMTITADIIRERSEVANEWMALLSDTTDDHTELHRMLLIRKIDETLKQEASNHAVVDNNPLPETDTTIRQTNDTVVVGIQGAFE
jgi:plasmid maintenance system antidote protein VapI